MNEPGLWGWAGVVAVVVAADVLAARRARRTMSAWVASSQAHPVAGPLVVGTAVGLGWHLFVWPILNPSQG